MIGIIDYGAGNMDSVLKALDHLGLEARTVVSPEGMGGIDRLIIPGVGSYGSALDRIEERGLRAPIEEWLREGRPLLGICLGMQLLYEGSEETPGRAGFGYFRGTCRRMLSRKVPHMGWNEAALLRPDPLFEGVGGKRFYFVHGYAAYGRGDDVLAVSGHDGEFVAACGRGGVRGVQFHPEKSGPDGLRLLGNWAASC